MRIPILISSLLLASTILADTPTPRANDLIVPLAAAPRILIPAAGDLPGANGTHFRSDIDVINLRDVGQTIELRWLPQQGTGSAVVRTMTLPPKSGVASENFVRDILQVSGLGAIQITGLTSQGAFDSSAALHATARIWTPQPDDGDGVDDEGTMSQTFPAIALTTPQTATLKTLFGLRRGAQYRLNAGITNLATTTQRFRISTYVSSSVLEPHVVELDLAGRSMIQVNIPGSTSGLVQILIENLSGGTEWHAWGSSVDNESGDAWSQMAFGG
jgi:hypothetical protein